MGAFEIISLLLNLLFGGGLVALLTLRAHRAKADAEAKSVEIDNDEKASKIMTEYIVNPLKIEIDELRKETARLRRNIRQLSSAISKINDCAYAEDCPVRQEMQKSGKEES
jgi:hypothetical protein